jgi:hypothetical protein
MRRLFLADSTAPIVFTSRNDNITLTKGTLNLDLRSLRKF